MKYGLTDDSVHKICVVLKRYPQVERAILYGSRAKGNYKKGSDIDLTLRGSADLTLNLLYRILDDLDELLLPYTIDLSILENIDDPVKMIGHDHIFAQMNLRPDFRGFQPLIPDNCAAFIYNHLVLVNFTEQTIPAMGR